MLSQINSSTNMHVRKKYVLIATISFSFHNMKTERAVSKNRRCVDTEI